MKKFSEQIIGYLEKFNMSPVKMSRLARGLGIGDAEYGDFRETVDALRRVGRVILGSNDALSLPHPGFHVVGTYRANPRGFGFVIPDDIQVHGDLYIGKGKALDAITGDKVMCEILSRRVQKGKNLIKAEIVTVLQRAHSRFVGQLMKEGKYWCVIPDGHILHVPILIGDPHARGAKAGDQVVVEITCYPSAGKRARGVIVERLGRPGEPDVEMLSIIRAFHLPETFPEELLQETRETARTFSVEECSDNREDLTGKRIITIDPKTARDFDDAISLEVIDHDGSPAWELGVHIADVSYFVEPEGYLDKEAQERGTSVYLPGHVIPMLPEILSNGLCSLQEGVPRLCKSVFIRYAKNGVAKSVRFCNSIIQSEARLTYEQATGILDGTCHDFTSEINTLVKEMERLARVIRKRRLDHGMLVLQLPDIELVLDDEGRIQDVRPEDQSYSHTIIEMFMVEANEAVAHLFERLHIPCLRRIHPEPARDAMDNLRNFFAAMDLPVGKRMNISGIQRCLRDVKDTPREYTANLYVLQSLKTAEYAPQPTGHFALASEAYLHFTSPIRRYPDLMAHRLLAAWLAGRIPVAGYSPTGWMAYPKVQHKDEENVWQSGSEIVSTEELEECGRDMSYKSRRAESAERDLKAVKILTLLEKEVGHEFKGVITGVAQFGLFIQHPVYLFDGLLRLENLGDDWWEVHPDKGSIRGVRSSREFKLGDQVSVKIEQVDKAMRQLSLSLKQVPKKKSKQKKKSRKRKGTEKKRKKKRT